MNLLHTSIGGGAVGSEMLLSTLSKILNDLQKGKKLKKNLNFCIIDKNQNNFFGGTAYSFPMSQFGYFNNPIRLSPNKFQKWLLSKKNRNKIIKYLKIYEDENGKNWINKYSIIFKTGPKKNNFLYNELYLPRVALSFWLKNKFFKIQKEITKYNLLYKKKIKIFFIKGEIKNIIKKKNNFELYLKPNFLEYSFSKTREELISLCKKKKNTFFKKKINSEFITLSLGLMKPKKIKTINVTNSDYIDDFYGQGSSRALLKKIHSLNKNKKKINLLLIGNKAGFLEPLNELKKIIFTNKINLKIYCFSKDNKFLNYATPSNKKYKLKIINNAKIKTAHKLFNVILKEFVVGKNYKFKKYDIWTEILRSRIINIHFNQLNDFEKGIYNYTYFDKIRTLTRFTNPETLKARDYLMRERKLFFHNLEVQKIEKTSGKLNVHCDIKNHNIFQFDLVVNVSGPNSLKNITQLPTVLKKLYQNNLIKLNKNNFLVDKYFRSNNCKNIYIPNMMAYGFNPNRETIVKAILQNTAKSSLHLNKCIRKNYV